MIIFLAGCSGCIQKMPNALKYEHVLFSKFAYLRRDFKWIKERKAAETKRRKKSK